MGVNTWPVEGGWRVTSTFGPRSSPGGNASTYHRGVDIAPPVAGTIGQGIVAAGGGTVTRVGTDYRNVKQGGSGYGGFVEIKHSDGTMTRYGHMSNVSVRPGDRVGEGDSIGRMGNSGESYGSHLHFQRVGKDGQKKSQMFDNDELNKRASKRGKGDGDDPKKDKDQEKKDKEDEGKEGKGEGNKDTKDSNKSRDKEEKPPKPKDKPDIQGETNNYRETTMKTISSRLPTHEPWIGHPKSTQGPRQGLQESGGDKGGGDDKGDQGGNSNSNSNSKSNGTSTNPKGENLSSNIDRSSDPDKARSIQRTADRLGINATDLATIISYETGGTFKPSQSGGMNKDGSGKGSFLGLIQFSPANQKKYGVSASDSFDKQMYAVENYLRDRGVKPGMEQIQVYSAINAGRAATSLNDPILQRSDVNGNQFQHIQKMNNNGHRTKGKKIMGSTGSAPPRADEGMNKEAAGNKPGSTEATPNRSGGTSTTPTS